MNRFCSSKIGLEQSHTECIFSQALLFFAMLFSPLVLCCFLPSVAFCAGQSRGILWDSSTTYKCGLKAAPPDKNRSQSRLSAVLRVLTGCSRLGARTGSTTGLVRCTRRWLQKYLSMDLSGRDTTSSMLSSWICCVNICFPLVACYLLSLSLDGFSATESFDGTWSFGSLGSLPFSLDL